MCPAALSGIVGRLHFPMLDGAEPALARARSGTATVGRLEGPLLELSADAPLFVSSVSRLTASPEQSVWVAVITPLEDAPGHLNVTITGLLDGAQQARSLQIPIRVGAKSENPGAASVKTDESGARIISLPAQESP